MEKIIFMGTPDFAVPVLKNLAEKYDVVAVVTQPDRVLGRKRVLTAPPVKVAANELGIPVYQPEKLRASEELDALLALDVDLLVTAAYGQILPNNLLALPKKGAINVHASLLPEYRGGAPIHYAVMDGKAETGVTIMYMVEKLDAGDMIAQRSMPITDEDDTGTMFEKLAVLGAALLMDTLPDFLAGKINAVPQNPEKVTFARNVSREQEKLDFSKEARVVWNHIRGLSPFPVAYTTFEGKPFKIWRAHLSSEQTDLSPGSFVLLTKSTFGIVCGDGNLVVPEIVQPFGKPKMDANAFIQGTLRNISKEVRFGD
ncbi:MULTISPECIES: methionyl-tRNA formyltransferase [Listeria]|uniref:methionyl-tRNA formyltransferase n=1 Tax=Listeria TaxID=1637 RepID=UPI000B5877FB|nr:MULTISPECIES: methionyl-tRNA formyltransferase [Listeria]